MKFRSDLFVQSKFSVPINTNLQSWSVWPDRDFWKFTLSSNGIEFPWHSTKRLWFWAWTNLHQTTRIFWKAMLLTGLLFNNLRVSKIGYLHTVVFWLLILQCFKSLLKLSFNLLYIIWFDIIDLIFDFLFSIVLFR